MDPGVCLRVAGAPASSGRRRVLPRTRRSLGVQTDAGCKAVALPGQAPRGAGGKMRPCARNSRLTREATGKAGWGMIARRRHVGLPVPNVPEYLVDNNLVSDQIFFGPQASIGGNRRLRVCCASSGTCARPEVVFGTLVAATRTRRAANARRSAPAFRQRSPDLRH